MDASKTNDSSEISKILRNAKRRGISRLVHFTRLSSLKEIIRDREILSRERLNRSRKEYALNDKERRDGFIDHICCSIQYPNMSLLNDFLNKYEEEWVVLFLNMDLLGLRTTKFCPVNAATECGQHVKSGLESFESLFENKVEVIRTIERKPKHDSSCPTDNQAEVLVLDTIPVSSITHAIVRSAEVKEDIEQNLGDVEIVPVICPELFDKAKIIDKISKSTFKEKIDSYTDKFVNSRNAYLRLESENLKTVTRKIPFGARLLVSDGEEVRLDQELFEACPASSLKAAEHSGKIRVREVSPNAVGRRGSKVLDSESDDRTEVALEYEHRTPHALPIGARLLVTDGAAVKNGDALFEWSPGIRQITPPFAGKLAIDDHDLLTISDSTDGESGQMSGRGVSVSIDVQAAKKSYSLLLPRGAKILTKDGDAVKKADLLCEWDPCMAQLLSQTEFISRISHSGPGDGGESSDGAWLAAAYTRSIDYPLPVGAVLSAGDRDLVRRGDVIARVPRESTKTSDITGGLPKVAELFDARTKEPSVIASVDGTIRFHGDYKRKRKLTIEPADGSQDTPEYQIPKSEHILVQDGDRVRKGDNITEGSPPLQAILDVLGIEALADHLVEEVQHVYRQQGVKINDKHIEVILRQMLRKVEVTDPGDTTLIAGDQLDRAEFEEINGRAAEDKISRAQCKPVLLGITKAALQTRSFISAASFQETTRVLTEAAVQGKRDMLKGLKENVIVGRLIPAGTGGAANEMRRIAGERDQVLIEERAELEQARIAAEELQLIKAIESQPDDETQLEWEPVDHAEAELASADAIFTEPEVVLPNEVDQLRSEHQSGPDDVEEDNADSTMAN